jgi:hypothetical protein
MPKRYDTTHHSGILRSKIARKLVFRLLEMAPPAQLPVRGSAARS